MSDERRAGHSKLVIKNEKIVSVNQADANFMAGIEVGVRCAEKGMNLQAALEFGKQVVREYPMAGKEEIYIEPADEGAY